MATPLQVQNPLNLQGNAPVLQGSGQPLQGGAVQLQGAPKQPFYPTPTGAAPVVPVQTKQTPVVQRKAVAATPVQAAAPTPVMQPQILNLMNEKVGVGPNGQVLASAPIQSTGQSPQQTPADPNQQIAKYAGAAGLDPAGLSSLLGLTPEERQGIYANLGIDTLANQVFSPPSQSTQQIYQTAYNSAGLADIKAKFQTLQDTINQKSQELNAAVGKVNENPWLSEASRIGRAKNLQELAQGEIANLVSQAQQYADLYNQGVSEVERLVGYSTQDFQNNQQTNAAKLQYLQSQAEQQIANATNAKLARYYPDYLQAAAATKKPDTLTLEDGSVVVWNPSTRKFDTVYKGQDLKNQPASYKEYQLAKQDGFQGSYNDYQTMDANRKRSVSNTYVGGLTPNQINSTINQIAGQFDNEPVVKQFNVINEGYQFAKSLSNTTQNPADDQALIYAYAKAMDPGSVVREGEYATVQKYSQSWIKSFGKGMEQAINGTGFLTPEARANIKATIEAKYNASKKNYDNVAKEYQRQIDDAKTGSTRTITNYGNAYQSDSPDTSTQYDFNALSQKYGY